jgi:hypothetical protein
MHPNAGCAVGGKRIVEARALAHVVDRIHVVKKNPPQVFTRPVDPVNINVLLWLAGNSIARESRLVRRRRHNTTHIAEKILREWSNSHPFLYASRSANSFFAA